MIHDKEPSCLNEIPKYHTAFQDLEDGENVHIPEYTLVKLEDVQRLVCRRILQIKDDIVGWDDQDLMHFIIMLKRIFNITDAMLEKERKRLG